MGAEICGPWQEIRFQVASHMAKGLLTSGVDSLFSEAGH